MRLLKRSGVGAPLHGCFILGSLGICSKLFYFIHLYACFRLYIPHIIEKLAEKTKLYLITNYKKGNAEPAYFDLSVIQYLPSNILKKHQTYKSTQSQVTKGIFTLIFDINITKQLQSERGQFLQTFWSWIGHIDTSFLRFINVTYVYFVKTMMVKMLHNKL